MPLEIPSDGELQREDNSSGRTKAIIIPAATSVEAPYTPTDDLESVSDDVGPDTPDGVSPVMVKSATRNLDVKVLADITATMSSSENVAETLYGPGVSSQKGKTAKMYGVRQDGDQDQSGDGTEDATTNCGVF